MDLFLTLTLILLHHVASYLCKPVSELTIENNTASLENYADIADLFKDINRSNIKNVGLDQTGDRKSVLHMIQLVHKDGSKAPVAIILTPADLATDIAKKYDNADLYESISDQKDIIEESPKSSEMPINDIPININAHNQKEINETTETSEMQNEVKDINSLENFKPEELTENQVAQGINTSINSVTAGKGELTDSETTLESELSYDNDGNNYDIVGNFNNPETFQTVTSEENIYDNNDNLNFNDNEAKTEKDDNSHIDDGLIIQNGEEDTKSNTLLKLEKSNEDSNEYVLPSDTTLISDNEVIPRETLTSDLINDNLHENISDDKFTLIQHNNKSADIFFGEISKNNGLESQINETGNTKLYIDGDNIKEMNIGCDIIRKAYSKEKHRNSDTHTYNLSFVFNS